MTALRSLSGIRVLDMTRVLAGPYASMIMGDLGAEVLKIERPQTGDDTRSWGPPFKGKESAYFLAVNRNKKSLTIDIKKSLGADLIRQLATKSDVLIENYLPGKLATYGLDYASLKKLNPSLVYCSLTGELLPIYVYELFVPWGFNLVTEVLSESETLVLSKRPTC